MKYNKHVSQDAVHDLNVESNTEAGSNIKCFVEIIYFLEYGLLGAISSKNRPLVCRVYHSHLRY